MNRTPDPAKRRSVWHALCIFLCITAAGCVSRPDYVPPDIGKMAGVRSITVDAEAAAGLATVDSAASPSVAPGIAGGLVGGLVGGALVETATVRHAESVERGVWQSLGSGIDDSEIADLLARSVVAEFGQSGRFSARLASNAATKDQATLVLALRKWGLRQRHDGSDAYFPFMDFDLTLVGGPSGEVIWREKLIEAARQARPLADFRNPKTTRNEFNTLSKSAARRIAQTINRR